MTLFDLQKKLKTEKLDGYLVPRNNMFLSQDLREDENLILRLTGFSGSDGTLLITRDKNILFVDGRYELQAPQETNPEEVEVFCTKEISIYQWLKNNTQDLKRFRLGINPWCFTSAQKDALEVNCIKVVSAPDFLPPMLSSTPANIFEHELQYAGQSRHEKIQTIIKHLKNSHADIAFFSLADSVSWLFNLRSNALLDTPILRAFALVSQDGKCWLFGDNLNSSHIKLDYPLLALKEVPAILKKFKHKKIAFDSAANSCALCELLQNNEIEIIPQIDYCQELKAIKNQTELTGIRQAHLRDGVAVTKFLCWLDKNWQGKTELDIAERLHQFRAKEELFFSESFTTIAASGANGAIVHYHPTAKTNAPLSKDSLLLLDSGAQYFDGTTDVTRTIALGNPNQQMAEDFTLVLKSHIALNTAHFPLGTTGLELDAIARAPLWASGQDYNHGTGHGVGCFLNVHEGPQRISRKGSSHPLHAQMITSIEPGIYKEGQYGIRIENLVEIVPSKTEGYLQFANLTLIPIDKRLINKYLLNEDEINWLNNYHQTVEQALSPYLSPLEKQWLQEACSPL